MSRIDQAIVFIDTEIRDLRQHGYDTQMNGEWDRNSSRVSTLQRVRVILTGEEKPKESDLPDWFDY